jgi:hypothetical protein
MAYHFCSKHNQVKAEVAMMNENNWFDAKFHPSKLCLLQRAHAEKYHAKGPLAMRLSMTVDPSVKIKDLVK